MSNNTLLGKPGPLVFKAPVLLADISHNISLHDTFILPKEILYAKVKHSEILLKHCTIDSDNKSFIINGVVLKTLQCLTLSHKKCLSSNERTIPFPFSYKIPINYSINPIQSTKSDTCYLLETTNQCYNPNKDITYDISSLKVTNDCLENCNDLYYHYSNTFNIETNLLLFQEQKIFIPEPEGKVFVCESNICKLSKGTYKYLEIGTNSDDTLIGQEKISL